MNGLTTLPCVTKTPERILCLGPLNVLEWHRLGAGRKDHMKCPKVIKSEIPNIFDGRTNCLINICSTPSYGLPLGLIFPPKEDSYSVQKDLSSGGGWFVKYSDQPLEVQLCRPNQPGPTISKRSTSAKQSDRKYGP